MKIKEIADKLGLEIINLADAETTVSGAYTCDLLSWVIGRAQTNDLLITIMSNANTVAVAVMADLAGIILTEGVKLDEAAIAKAKINDVNVFTSQDSSFVLSAKLKNLLDFMDKKPCEIVAELGRTKNQQDYLTKSKELKVGSILKLDNSANPDHRITLFANGNLIAKGNTYASDEKFAFYIWEFLNNDFDGSYGEDLIYDGIRVELARREIPLKEIKELKIKDVIKFDREIKAVTITNNYCSYPNIQEVYADIFIGDKLIAKGICVGVDDNQGVKITEIIPD